MGARLVRSGFVVLAAACLAAQAKQPDVEEVLRASAGYLAEFERALGTLTAQEEYTQEVPGVATRILRSDMLFFHDEQFGWVEFRDVAVVDGVPVRDRELRLLNLFQRPTPDRLAQAQRIVAEGARFNLHAPRAKVNRTINLPLTALRYLRGPAQRRSEFSIADSGAGSDTVVLSFREREEPRLIRTEDGTAARGKFEVHRPTGRVLSSELTLPTKATTAVIQVRFALHPGLQLWLPDTMQERYVAGPLGQRINGLARYSEYRQFRVDTSFDVGKDPPNPNREP